MIDYLNLEIDSFEHYLVAFRDSEYSDKFLVAQAELLLEMARAIKELRQQVKKLREAK